MTIDLTLENFCVRHQRQDFEIQCNFKKQAFILQNQNLALTVSCVLQCVAACCSVLQCFAALQCVAVCCSVLQCVAVCCSVLQRVAVC